MRVHLVLLTLGASFDILLDVVDQLRPPVILGYQVSCSVDARVSIGWYIMICLHDFVLVLLSSRNHLAAAFPPFSIDLLEVVGSSPLSYYSFILL